MQTLLQFIFLVSVATANANSEINDFHIDKNSILKVADTIKLSGIGAVGYSPSKNLVFMKSSKGPVIFDTKTKTFENVQISEPLDTLYFGTSTEKPWSPNEEFLELEFQSGKNTIIDMETKK